MCPITLEELRHMGPATPIAEDRPCIKCSYNLKGLTSRDRCPECGTPVRARVASVRQSGMIEADPAYVRQVRNGMWYVIGSGAGAFVTAIVAGAGFTDVLHLSTVLGMIWSAGVWLVTMPRHADDVLAGDQAAMRWTIRAMAAGFVVAGAAVTWILMRGFGGGGHILARFGVLGGISGMLGAVGLMWWCAKLAEWANDDATARVLRFQALAVPFGFVCVLMGAWIGSFLGLWAGSGAAIIGAWIGGAIPVALVGWALLRFVRLIEWSKANAEAIKAKDERLRERARIAAQTGRDPGFTKQPRLCSACGYDLAGILRSPVCPECGESIE